MCTGLRPKYNIDATNPNQYRDWHRLSKLDDAYIDSTSKSGGALALDPTVAWNGASTMQVSSQSPVEKLTYPVSTPSIDTVRITAHSIEIFAPTKAAFFNEYMPFTFGGANILTPQDPGALLVNFCLYPGTYQPSGHINVSRAREFYFDYESSYVSALTPAELIIVAAAINFLLISDGSAVLRYTT